MRAHHAWVGGHCAGVGRSRREGVPVALGVRVIPFEFFVQHAGGGLRMASHQLEEVIHRGSFQGVRPLGNDPLPQPEGEGYAPRHLVPAYARAH